MFPVIPDLYNKGNSQQLKPVQCFPLATWTAWQSWKTNCSNIANPIEREKESTLIHKMDMDG